ncbi:hypothetical protein OG361_13365 [Streptomyces sp. NBC_00090]|uniref:collagen-binding domain-containing protein n=1 Tax=Streptomyces sp. NBC_00090 TaxID=2903619 RepID=UPI003243F112
MRGSSVCELRHRFRRAPAASATPATSCATQPLGTAGLYAEFVEKDSVRHSDSEGAVAVGGDATFGDPKQPSGFSIGHKPGRHPGAPDADRDHRPHPAGHPRADPDRGRRDAHDPRRLRDARGLRVPVDAGRHPHGLRDPGDPRRGHHRPGLDPGVVRHPGG